MYRLSSTTISLYIALHLLFWHSGLSCAALLLRKAASPCFPRAFASARSLKTISSLSCVPWYRIAGLPLAESRRAEKDGYPGPTFSGKGEPETAFPHLSG